MYSIRCGNSSGGTGESKFVEKAPAVTGRQRKERGRGYHHVAVETQGCGELSVKKTARARVLPHAGQAAR
jgi:hypothetical protein